MDGSDSSSLGAGLSVRLPIRHVALATVSLPFSAFLLCVFLSIRYNFDLATATHCGVRVKCLAMNIFLNLMNNICSYTAIAM